MEPTKQQKQAIFGRGGSLLISAGAGSGKTSVLVERLLNRIRDKNDPKNIDDFLIITYTRAAAGELRSRITKTIGEILAKEPNDRHLRHQITRIAGAKISTAHAFCASLLREFAPVIGISPSFRIPDETECETLRRRLLSRLLEEKYEEGDGEFLFLVNTLGDGRNDDKLVSAVLALDNTTRSICAPEAWMQEQIRSLKSSPDTDPADTLWGKALLEDTLVFAEDTAASIQRAMVSMETAEDIALKYTPAFSEDLGNFQRVIAGLRRGCRWDEIAGLCGFGFSSLKTVRNPSDPMLKDAVQSIRNGYKDQWKKRQPVFTLEACQVMEDVAFSGRSLVALLELTGQLQRRYSQAKAEKNLLEYADLEHMTLQLLQDETMARDISARFAEVLVDEYQDTNEIQDTIFRAVSDGGKKLFMVGDVKQSIYRFRLAEPEIFLEKYDRFVPYDSGEAADCRRIDLNANFRSDSDILDFVNRIFTALMSRRLGGLEYTNSEALHSLNPSPTPCPCAQIHILNTKDALNEDGTEADGYEAEAVYTAKTVRELIDNGMDTPKGHVPVAAGDIAILLRSANKDAPLYRQALAKVGISCQSKGDNDIFRTLEVQTLVSLLHIIDNPRQDIPLVTVLHSALFGFSADELAQLRLTDKDALLYDALIEYAKGNEKAAAFLSFLHDLRRDCVNMAADELIWRIFCLTNMREIFSSMEGGSSRKQNLDTVYSYAVKCVSEGKTGLFSFLQALDSMAQQGGGKLSPPPGGGADSVRILSIHSSKGLEFPVVFLCNCGKQFNKESLKGSLLMHKKLGIASRCIDTERMLSYDTVARYAIRNTIEQESLSEELRILYVALTRAKHRLFITMSGKTVASGVKKCASLFPPDGQLLLNAAGMGQWILSALLGGMGPGGAEEVLEKGYLRVGSCAIRYLDNPDLTLPSILPADIRPEGAARDEYIDQISRTLAWQYPMAGAENIPSKLTATQLKAENPDGQEYPTPAPMAAPLRRPVFITRDTRLSAGERGTATHTVLQYIDYSRCGSLEQIDGQIARLVAIRQMTQQQADSVDRSSILAFFRTPIGQKLVSGCPNRREFKFSLLCPAADYYPEANAQDTVLLQGVVDVCLEDGDALTVLDFKTDYVTEETQPLRAAHYAPQVQTYGKALQRITGKPVRSLLLYFFATGTFTQIPVC